MRGVGRRPLSKKWPVDVRRGWAHNAPEQAQIAVKARTWRGIPEHGHPALIELCGASPAIMTRWGQGGLQACRPQALCSRAASAAWSGRAVSLGETVAERVPTRLHAELEEARSREGSATDVGRVGCMGAQLFHGVRASPPRTWRTGDGRSKRSCMARARR